MTCGLSGPSLTADAWVFRSERGLRPRPERGRIRRGPSRPPPRERSRWAFLSSLLEEARDEDQEGGGRGGHDPLSRHRPARAAQPAGGPCPGGALPRFRRRGHDHWEHGRGGRWAMHLVFCPRSLWTRRRAERGAPPRNMLSRNPHRALGRSDESEATACGNAQKPRFRGGAPRSARRRESTDFWDTTLKADGSDGDEGWGA